MSLDDPHAGPDSVQHAIEEGGQQAIALLGQECPRIRSIQRTVTVDSAQQVQAEDGRIRHLPADGLDELRAAYPRLTGVFAVQRRVLPQPFRHP